MKAMIFDIERGSLVDGPGIRTTVFFKGCNLACAWCHNPESQHAEAQMMVYPEKCVACGNCRESCPNKLSRCDRCGICAQYCPSGARELCGREYTVDELMGEILRDRDFYATSGGGVTFSGGECMLQIDVLEALLAASKEHGIHTAVDTAGHLSYARFERILPHTDLFLFDIKCLDPETHRRYTGADNALILENLRRLLASGASVWIRIPIVPTVNDTVEEMQAIKAFLDSCAASPARVELLPYHAMGEHKYAALGEPVTKFSTPTEDAMSALRRVFE